MFLNTTTIRQGLHTAIHSAPPPLFISINICHFNPIIAFYQYNWPGLWIDFPKVYQYACVQISLIVFHLQSVNGSDCYLVDSILNEYVRISLHLRCTNKPPQKRLVQFSHPYISAKFFELFAQSISPNVLSKYYNFCAIQIYVWNTSKVPILPLRKGVP